LLLFTFPAAAPENRGKRKREKKVTKNFYWRKRKRKGIKNMQRKSST
jgi:hypothetical protein